MKKFFMFVCLLFSGKSVWSQNAGDVWNEYSISKPKGRVVMMTYKDYDEVYSFGEVSEVKRKQGTTVAYFNKNGLVCYERNIDGAKRSEISYLYDDGKLTKCIEAQPKATESGVSYDTIAVRTYTYDDSGRMKTRSDWKNNTLTKKDRFEYTSTGYMMYCYKGDGSLDITWERKGNTLSSSVKDGQKLEYVFDDDGRVIQQNLFLGATNGFAGISTNSYYNQYGDIMCNYTSAGSSLRNNDKKAVVYTRLPNGNVVANLEDQYSDELHTKKGSVFKYEYDAKNNWTIQSNVTKKTRVTREIVYAKSDNDFSGVEHAIATSRQSLDSVLYEETVLEPHRIKEEKEALAADTRKRTALTASRRKKIKMELMEAYDADYPYICKAVRFFKNKLSINFEYNGSTPFGADCVFHPIDEDEKRAKYYIEVQQTIIRSLNDKTQMKDCKTLELSLKKAETDKQRVNLLEDWLRGQGYNLEEIPTGKDPQKTELLNLYQNFDQKLKNMATKSNIAQIGCNYIIYRLGGRFLEDRISDTNLVNISLKHLNKCIEVQKFICQLLQDAEQKKELEDILRPIEHKYPKSSDARRRILYFTFENYLNRYGIEILEK